MIKKTATIDLKGKAYAQVKDRLKEFRADNPNGLIETTPTISDTSIIFKARILKDKSNPASAEATGHSFAKVTEKNVEKQFEKQETIAVGRALVFLGYGSDGEIASSEEMEEFLQHKQDILAEKIFEITERVGLCETEDTLKKEWAGLSGDMRSIEVVKNAFTNRKNQINEKN